MVVKVKDIDEYNRYFHQKTYHPMVSIGDLSRADLSLFVPTDFDMYCVVLMEVDFGVLLKGGHAIRYKAGTMFTLSPGEVVSMNLDPSVHPRGWMLAFRPEFLVNTGLGRDFYMFDYFDIKVHEALELHESERRVMLNCYANINAELHAADDALTGHMLRLGIGQLLSYCKRYYERQFDTSTKRNSEFVARLSALLDEYLSPESVLPERLGPPTVAWCSSQFHITPNYFGDLVKRELHTTAQEYIQNRIIEKAKSLIADSRLSINEVAELLGFNYPNHFTRFFRNKTGISPMEFRKNIMMDI